MTGPDVVARRKPGNTPDDLSGAELRLIQLDDQTCHRAALTVAWQLRDRHDLLDVAEVLDMLGLTRPGEDSHARHA